MGYKVDCSADWQKGCTIFLSPFETTYDTFLGYLKEKTLELGFTFDYNSDQYDYDTVNEKIKKKVPFDVKNQFAKGLGTFNPRYPIDVKVVPKLDAINGNTYSSKE
ncbi:Hypothetical protein SRAE_X000023200 [Strongyloides ratti]|uniref:Uncharacterized protein n=1 Tax=Strongyloides ratti TaxID=34506 RepID=A0A090LRS9_STRRB|nr:Hypothetical protein SRAE_X000023200 [Strongyloides ratti]CEF70902.1 Hypothetical protein SRAE_X000023200 [Strongyloides ratti]